MVTWQKKTAGALIALMALGSCGLSTPEGARVSHGYIDTFMGTGRAGLGAEGASLRQTDLYLPQDLTFGPDGRPYVIDWNNHRVRVVDKGRVYTLIGTGELGDAPAGPAREIGLNHPTHIAFDPYGRLILAAWHNSKVLRYDFATGFIAPICGTGERAYGGDSGPATEALVNLPSATAFDPQGRLYISDQENQRVRRIGLDGTITTVVGTGLAGFSGDGGPATEARIFAPEGQAAPPTSRIAIDGMGVLYLADTFNNRVRRVGLDGIIATVAGNGLFPPQTRGETDENAPALDVSLYWPCDLAIDSEGRLFIADTYNHCVRLVELDGTITTVAGQCGLPGDAGDRGPATAAKLNRPYGIALDEADNLYIADTRNHRIRVVRR